MTNQSNPYIIGLTGGIGSGKSTITNWFRLKGISVWDADVAVHAIYKNPDDDGFQKIVDKWPSVFNGNHIDRNLLRSIVVSDNLANEWLKNTLTASLEKSRCVFMFEHQSDKIVVWDVPLLVESNLHKLVDSVVVIDVQPEVQRSRIRARNVWTEDEITSMLSKQLSNDARICYGNVIVRNNNTLDELYSQLDLWWSSHYYDVVPSL